MRNMRNFKHCRANISYLVYETLDLLIKCDICLTNLHGKIKKISKTLDFMAKIGYNIKEHKKRRRVGANPTLQS